MRETLTLQSLGVLTKVDRIESGTALKWLNIFRNKENALENGWFCVKQPDLTQLRAGITWEEAKLVEANFFQATEPWSGLEYRLRQRLGYPGLTDHLGKTLSDLVAQKYVLVFLGLRCILILLNLMFRLPGILAELTRQLGVVDSDLQDLPAPRYSNPRLEVVTLIRDFTRRVSQMAAGLPPANLSDPSTSGMMHQLHAIFDRFRDGVHRSAPAFRPWLSTAALTNASRTEMINLARKDDAPLRLHGLQLVETPYYIDQVMSLAQRLAKSAFRRFHSLLTRLPAL